jgi:hypothetical protein
MAYGQNQTFVAPPQPGTSNLPYATTVPKGGLSGKFGGTTTYPPFVPVVVEVEDFYAEAIQFQILDTNAAIKLAFLEIMGSFPGFEGPVEPGTLASIANKLNLIAKLLSEWVELVKIQSQQINDTAIAKSSMVSLSTEENIIQSFEISDQISTNNYYKIASGETPTLPSWKEIIKETLKKVKDFNVLVEAEGLIKSASDKLTELVKDQLKIFDAKFGITEWFKYKVAAIKSALTPPSPKQVRDAIEAKTVVDWTNSGC